jgi:hypothetical protein
MNSMLNIVQSRECERVVEMTGQVCTSNNVTPLQDLLIGVHPLCASIEDAQDVFVVAMEVVKLALPALDLFSELLDQGEVTKAPAAALLKLPRQGPDFDAELRGLILRLAVLLLELLDLAVELLLLGMVPSGEIGCVVVGATKGIVVGREGVDLRLQRGYLDVLKAVDVRLRRRQAVAQGVVLGYQGLVVHVEDALPLLQEVPLFHAHCVVIDVIVPPVVVMIIVVIVVVMVMVVVVTVGAGALHLDELLFARCRSFDVEASRHWRVSRVVAVSVRRGADVGTHFGGGVSELL